MTHLFNSSHDNTIQTIFVLYEEQISIPSRIKNIDLLWKLRIEVEKINGKSEIKRKEFKNKEFSLR